MLPVLSVLRETVLQLLQLGALALVALLADWLRGHLKRVEVRGARDQVRDAAREAVVTVEQTYVGPLKDPARQDVGEWTDAARLQAREAAIKLVYALEPGLHERLRKTGLDPDVVVSTAVDTEVHRRHAAAAA